jgi:CheY-like chemotaxis protein
MLLPVPAQTLIKVLVADDHAEFRRTVVQMFENQDAVMSEAASGEEAVQRFAAERPDWVIMDLRMPGMSGIKATEAIRRLDPQARVIVISQFTEPEYREQARRAGAVGFLAKEEMSRLVEVVRGQNPQL